MFVGWKFTMIAGMIRRPIGSRVRLGPPPFASLIPVLVTGIQCAQVLERGRLFEGPYSRRRRAVAGFL